ncbi:M13 family metallopeptidase [Persicobacter psychrovividus]|uniref:Endothelin-converting protein n=1 Tax=Persicobacter psychrovividus TaxID=387638 RepID=A0ABM7VDS3_9BACT|nr:endothelin-converting protein [Persicobacter psychrovividus]
MMIENPLRKIGYTALFSLCFMACSEKEPAQQPKDNTVHGINIKNMDKRVDPSEDFYKYVNGGWDASTNIPDDQLMWGSFNELEERNVKAQKEIIEQALQNKDKLKGDQLKAIQIYALAKDTESINKEGHAVLDATIAAIAKVKDKKQIPELAGQLATLGVGSFFDANVSTDRKNSKENALYFEQGGLTLPDRQYYLDQSEHFESIRTAYADYIAALFTKMGNNEDVAQQKAKHILDVESKIAKISWTPAKLRNPDKTYNKMSASKFDRSFAHFDLNAYMKAANIDASAAKEIIVGQPDYFQHLGRIMHALSLDELKDYLAFRTINSYASFFGEEYHQLTFDFFSKKLNGAKKMQPEWKRNLSIVNATVGEGFGQLYVAKVFPEEAKAQAAGLIKNIRTVLGERIDQLSWMSEETKKKAHEKLDKITVKIGYPDKWKSYENLKVDPQSFLQTIINVNKFEYSEMVNKLGQPVDKSKWEMNPQEVNAYYEPTNNEIVFPAAILQPPFYDYKADKAVNYGGIGAVIGHEITHGFDDEGRKYDADGNQKDWWTKEDAEHFDALAQKVVAQFNDYTVLDSVHVNGQLTLGENIADLGGVTLAYHALLKDLEKNGRPGKIDGFTPEQRFFMSWATVWRTKARNEIKRRLVMVDPHAPGQYRAFAPLSNFEPFQKAFNIKDGTPMVRKDRIVIW